MAAGPWIMPNLAKLNIANATNILNGTSTNFRIALLTSSWTPAPTTDEVWATMSANEVANGAGYTTGGGTLTSVALTQSAGTVKFTSAAFVWTSSGSFPAFRYAMIYYLGTLNSKVNPLVCYCLGDSTPADVPITTTGNTLTFTPNASGIVTIA